MGCKGGYIATLACSKNTILPLWCILTAKKRGRILVTSPSIVSVLHFTVNRPMRLGALEWHQCSKRRATRHHAMDMLRQQVRPGVAHRHGSLTAVPHQCHSCDWRIRGYRASYRTGVFERPIRTS